MKNKCYILTKKGIRGKGIRSKPGFTFIELILTIVIMGIFLAIAIPRFSFGEKRAQTTAKKIASDLRVVRSLAINKGVVYYLQFYNTSPYTEYKIFDVLNNQVGETRAIPTEVTCTASVSQFSFNYLGACNAGVDGTITLSDAKETHTINITGFTGRAYVP